MTDREMIEQMENDICNACKPRVAKCKGNFPCAMCGIVATELVEKYQPKIPEDSIVLTKKEWENYKSSFRNQLYCKDVQYGIEIKELRNDRDYWREEYRQARKETAREILIKGKQLVEKWLSKDDEKVGFLFDFEEFIKKQFGVEIKE